MPSSLNVAVIGAGVAGLVAGRELMRVGHRVTIFEKQNQLGGTWVYDPRVESDLLSVDPDREIIQNSLYSSLRTNLPRHLMGFSDFSFTKIYDDPRTFPSHEEVLKFLNDFALHFGVNELIKLSTEVVRVELRNDKWIVESRSGELTQEDVFDAVVVCNGQFTEPRVANFPVIGAGVAGLVAGRELQRVGHRVTIFEKQNQLGGTWVYDPRIESDLLSQDPDREIIHTSLYSSLRTNFPRHIMGFSDFPFTKVYEDSRTFPSHEEVLKFLNDFAEQFGIIELTRFSTEVVGVELRGNEWIVESRTGELIQEEVFDAVVVCNGHHTEPRVANFTGIEKWPGMQIHSHNYRDPEPFRDQIVVVIGAGPSAIDTSREIAEVAKEVHVSARSTSVFSKLPNFEKLKKHSEIDYVDETGRVAFKDGSSVQADIIFHCTGYRYNFPFLKTNRIVTVEDNRVGPFYKHVFPPELAPMLSFIGIPYGITGFPMMELQAKWISLVLSGQLFLPSKEIMMADTEDYYKSLEQQGIPLRGTHSLFRTKFDYPDWLANQMGVPPIDERIKEIYAQLFTIVFSSEVGRLREWDVDSWIGTII